MELPTGAVAAEQWRAHRVPERAALVDALVARAAAAAPVAIAGKDKAAFQAAWLAAARLDPGDPVRTLALAETVARSVPVREISYLNPERDAKRYRHFLDRVEALAARPHVPGAAAALAELVERAPIKVDDAAAVYAPVIALIVAIGDDRVVDRLRALLARPLAKTATLRDYFAGALPDAIARLEDWAANRPKLSRREAAELARVLAAAEGAAPSAAPLAGSARRSPRDLEALLAECLAHPDDDAPRTVYSDALLERDDPRGQLIQLQLAHPADRKTAASILRKHEKTWLGDLVRVTKVRVWRRGFLDEAELLQGAAADAATWQRCTAAPALATVRTLHKGKANEDLYASFVQAPAMRALAWIDVPSSKFLRALAPPRGHAYDHLEVALNCSPSTLALVDEHAPRLGATRIAFGTTLGPAEAIALLAAWPGRARFREITLVPSIGAWRTWDRSRYTWLFAGPQLGVPRLGLGEHTHRLVVERAASGGGLRVDAMLAQEAPLAHLLGTSRLPSAIERVVLRGVPAPWFAPSPAIRRALAKLPAGAVELHDGWASQLAGPGRP